MKKTKRVKMRRKKRKRKKGSRQWRMVHVQQQEVRDLERQLEKMKNSKKS